MLSARLLAGAVCCSRCAHVHLSQQRVGAHQAARNLPPGSSEVCPGLSLKPFLAWKLSPAHSPSPTLPCPRHPLPRSQVTGRSDRSQGELLPLSLRKVLSLPETLLLQKEKDPPHLHPHGQRPWLTHLTQSPPSPCSTWSGHANTPPACSVTGGPPLLLGTRLLFSLRFCSSYLSSRHVATPSTWHLRPPTIWLPPPWPFPSHHSPNWQRGLPRSPECALLFLNSAWTSVPPASTRSPAPAFPPQSRP